MKKFEIFFIFLFFSAVLFLYSNNNNEEFVKKILLEIEKTKSQINIKQPTNDYLKIAHLYIQIDYIDQAIEYVNKAIENEPKNPRAYYLLALIYEKKKNYIKAINQWEKVLNYSNTKEMKEIAQKHIDYLKKIKK